MLLGQELKFKNKLCNFKRVPFSVTSQGNTLGNPAMYNTPCFTLIEQALSVFFNVNYI